MMSTQNHEKIANSSNYTKENITVRNIGQIWTNFDKRPNNESNYLVFCDNLEQRIGEIKNNPWKLQEQCYINNTMKITLGISANEKEVLGAIYGVTRDSGVGYLTNKYISNATRLSISSIKNYLRKFENLGLIVRQYERKGMKVTRNYTFTEIFFKVAELSGNKCIKRPEAKLEVNECQNLHEMTASPVSTHGQNLSINNTSIIDNNISTNILLSNKVNTCIKVNSENRLQNKEYRLKSYNKLIDEFVDLNFKNGRTCLKRSLRKYLQILHERVKPIKGDLRVKNSVLISKLNKLKELSGCNAGKALTILQVSNTQHYKDLYEPNVKTSIAYQDKACLHLIKNIGYINSKLTEDDPRYETNLILKNKAFSMLSTWSRVENGLPTLLNNEYSSNLEYIENPKVVRNEVNHNYEKVDEMLTVFTRVNEGQTNELSQMDEHKKLSGKHKNCQGAGDPLYNFDGSQRIEKNVHLEKAGLITTKKVATCEGSYECYEMKYDPEQIKNTWIVSDPEYKAKSIATYNIELYDDPKFLINELNEYPKEPKEACGDPQVKSHATKNLVLNRDYTTVGNEENPKIRTEFIYTEKLSPPPKLRRPPSPHVNERIKRGDLGVKQRAKIKKCKFIPPGGKSGLNELKSGQNEKKVKRDESDLEFIRKCLERAKKVLLN